MIKLPNSYMSRYKWRMFSYRIKSFLKNIFGNKEKRGSRIFSIFAVLIMVLLIASISVYGLNLKSRAENQTQISSTTFLAYDGVSIHTKAARIVGGVSDYSATAKSGDTIRFTLTVSNANTANTSTDVKFTLPAGFSYQGMKNGTIPSGSPNKESCTGATAAAGDTPLVLYWCAYNAIVGESMIEFDTKAP